MNYKLEDLIDVKLVQNLQNKLNVIYSFPSAIVDNEGKILTAVAWQNICTKFHRIHSESEKECIKSDQYILKHLNDAKPAVSYKCPHGLIDNATPIIIDGKHLGNFFIGQFFLDEKPDVEFFTQQAAKFGFNLKEYLEAVEKVPVWTREKLNQYLDFIKGFIEIIAGIGLKNLKEIESNRILNESEERYKAIVECTSDWVWEIDAQWKYIYCSENISKILGYKVDEVIGKTPFDLMPLEESELVKEKFTSIANSKNPIVDLENWNLHKEGHRVCLLTNGSPIFDRIGNVIGYKGADKDITERKQFEASQAEIMQRLRLANKATNDVIWDWDVINDTQQWNEAGIKVFGWTEIVDHPVKAQWWVERVHPQDRDRVHESFFAVVNNSELDNWQEEYRFAKADGNYADVLDRGYVLRNIQGKAIRMIGAMQDITERKQAELLFQEKNDEISAQNKNLLQSNIELIAAKEKTEESNKQFRNLFENAADAMFIADESTGIILDANKSAEQLMQMKCDEIVGLHHTKLHPPKTAKFSTDSFSKHKKYVEQQKLTPSIENKVIRKDGTEVPVEVLASRVFYKGKNCLLGTFRNITERIQAQHLLHEKNEEITARILEINQKNLELKAAKEEAERKEVYLQTLLSINDDAIVSRDLNNNVVYFNKAFDNTTKYIFNKPAYVGMNTLKLLPKEAKEFWENILSQVKNGKRNSYEYVFQSFDNKIGYFVSNHVPIEHGNKIIGTLEVTKDITHYKERELELSKAKEKAEESEFRLKLATESGKFGIWDWNVKDNVMLWDSRMFELYGINSGRFPKTIDAWLSGLHPEDKQRAIDECNAALNGEKDFNTTFRVLHPDGKVLYLKADSLIIRDKEGKAVRMIGLNVDVTEIMQAQLELEKHRNHLEELVKLRTEELERANESLKKVVDKEKELNEMKSRFVSTTSHEFRTPLTAVLSSTELLQRYAHKWNDEKKNEHLLRIQSSVEYLTNLLDDILTLNRAESGKISYNPESIDLYKFSEESLLDAKLLISLRHDLQFNYKSKQKEFFLDPKLMRFIFNNLLSNAAKYSPDGGVIKLKISNDKKNLKIEVSDEGVGISPHDINKIFDSFYRTKNVEGISGTGLGLAIVKRAVELHNGEITVASELEKGTTFTVKIPITA